MPALVVPGVRVEARFDILPPLLAPSGIAGIVDRIPAGGNGLTTSARWPTSLRETMSYKPPLYPYAD